MAAIAIQPISLPSSTLPLSTFEPTMYLIPPMALPNGTTASKENHLAQGNAASPNHLDIARPKTPVRSSSLQETTSHGLDNPPSSHEQANGSARPSRHSAPPPPLDRQNSAEAEARRVQETYARIDAIGGVPRDGFVDGVELTRERRTDATINGYLSASNSGVGLDSSEAAGDSSGGVVRSRTVSARSNGYTAASTAEEEKAELDLLQKTDRYGFFNPTFGHSRVVLLPKAEAEDLPPKKPLKSAGKNRSDAPAAASVELPSPYLSMDGKTRSSTIGGSSSLSTLASTSTSATQRSKELARADKWFTEMLVPNTKDQGGNVTSWRLRESVDEKRLRRRVCKGIPDRWRSAAWEALIRRRREMQRDGRGKGKDRENEQLERDYHNLILTPSAHDVQIDLDVPRTVSGHLYFHTRYGQGQRALFNVLHAFALLCPDQCGYCQGMGSLAATLLCYATPEKVYSHLVHLHSSYDLHSIFSPGFPGMLVCFAQQEKLVQLLLPSVHVAFEKNFISISSFATKWYITGFANVVSFSTQLRLWDIFLLEGLDAWVVASTAIIWVLRKHFAHPKADFESILSILSSFFVAEDEDALLRWIKRVLKNREIRQCMTRWRAEEEAKMAKEA